VTAPDWPRFTLSQTAPFTERVRYYTTDEVARSRTSPEIDQLQRRLAEFHAKLMWPYGRALDDAAMLLLAHGCRDIARVLQPNGVDELWIDAPADRQRVGELMPGRCVYRQWMSTEDGAMTISTEWLDPELAGQAVQA